MHLLFTEDDSFVHHRSRYLRGGLLRNFHQISMTCDFSHPPDTDLWLHGLSHNPDIPFRDPVQRCMEHYFGTIAFFQNDDHLGFALDKIPQPLRNRASLFLRNVWPSDPGLVAAEVRDRTGFLNPLLKPLDARPGKPLAGRNRQVIFYGAATGGVCPARIEAVRMLKSASIPFQGGLVKRPHTSDPPRDLLADPLDTAHHSRALSGSVACLALHGNCPLTYRLFEGFSRRCLVIAQSLESIRFIDCGLTPGIHYVQVREDLSDLVERTRYYLDHPGEAQTIANAGFAHFKKNFAFSGVNLPQPLYREIIGSWKNVPMPRGGITVRGIVTKLLLPVIHSL